MTMRRGPIAKPLPNAKYAKRNARTGRIEKRAGDPGAGDPGDPGDPGDTTGNTTTAKPTADDGRTRTFDAFLKPDDAARVASDATDSEQPRRGGGRPAGSRDSYQRPRPVTEAREAVAKERIERKAKVETSVAHLEGILLSMHMMMAHILKIRELEIDKPEAKELADRLAAVAALYNIEATEKGLAWTNLMMCAGGIYGMRLSAYAIRVRKESTTPKNPEAEKRKATMYPFPQSEATQGTAFAQP